MDGWGQLLVGLKLKGQTLEVWSQLYVSFFGEDAIIFTFADTACFER